MANGGVTASGLKELADAIEQLPDAVTAALKGVARDTAIRAQSRAKQILQSKLKTNAHALVDHIVVIDESEKQRYVVNSSAPPGQWPNLALAIEKGTVKMAARPYMRPAGDAEDERYKQDSVAAAVAVFAPLEKT